MDVVHDLEAEPEHEPPLGHRLDDLVRCTCDYCARPGAHLEHCARLSLDHGHVVLFGHLVTLLELEVLLLPLRDATDHLANALYEWPELLVIDVCRVGHHLEAEG